MEAYFAQTDCYLFLRKRKQIFVGLLLILANDYYLFCEEEKNSDGNYLTIKLITNLF